MFSFRRPLLIAATAAPLAVVLAAGMLVAMRRPQAEQLPREVAPPVGQAPPATVEKRKAAPPLQPPRKPRLLAVTADGFDAFGDTLRSLGEGYRYEVLDEDDLLDAAALKRFEAVFLTCAEEAGRGPRAGLAEALAAYVKGGGTLYASDLRFDLVAAAFGESVDRAAVAQGTPQELRAEVASPELRDVLGPAVDLHFKSKGWRTSAFQGDDVSVLLKGKLRTTAGVDIDAPLAVRFTAGEGTVLFTSFHAEGDAGAEEARLARFLALKAVTSAAEAREVVELAGSGFVPRSVVAAEAGPTDGPHVFVHDKAGPLRFHLAPARPGAKLRLTVTDPGGKTATKEGGSTLAFALSEARPGSWTFRAEAESAPYPSFPVVLMVGVPAEEAGGGPAARANPAAAEVGGNVRFEEVLPGNKPVKVEPRPMRIAVSKPHFDDMGRLLTALGPGYSHQQLEPSDLLDSRTLDRFDVLFLTCAGYPREWFSTFDEKRIRSGLDGEGVMRPDIEKKMNAAISGFVTRGGTLYASDRQYSSVTSAFPARIPRADLNLAILPELARAERAWLTQFAPLANVKTSSETVDDLALGEELMKHRDELCAAVNTSILIGIVDRTGGSGFEAAIRDRTRQFGIPATDADCALLAAAFHRRRDEIDASARSRNRKKVRDTLSDTKKAEARLKGLRDRLIVNYDGAARQAVEAEVVDSGLREFVGEKIRLRFPDNAWMPSRFDGEDAQVLIRGTYRSMEGERIEAPLLVRFREGQGTVIFTSFHNEAQNSQQELQLLRYLVFSAVTAKQESETLQTMLTGGFSPVKQGQVNHAVGNDSITKKYRSESGEPLRFALTFADSRARLRLTLVAPGGSTFEKETEDSIVIEATGGPAGEWLYTVTSLRVPYENFAYSVSIGKGSAPANRNR